MCCFDTYFSLCTSIKLHHDSSQEVNAGCPGWTNYILIFNHPEMKNYCYFMLSCCYWHGPCCHILSVCCTHHYIDGVHILPINVYQLFLQKQKSLHMLPFRKSSHIIYYYNESLCIHIPLIFDTVHTTWWVHNFSLMTSYTASTHKCMGIHLAWL